MSKTKLLVIVGPTASGKTSLAITLAQTFNGEVISADSRQIYRGLDIGSGKVTCEEMAGIPHHLIDIADPQANFSASDFKRSATQALTKITKRDHLPIVAGGTGFYIKTLVDNLELPAVPPNQTLRRELDQLSTTELALRLKTLDQNRFQNIDIHNRPRLIRAIEIATVLGQVPVLAPTDSPFDLLLIGLYIPPTELNIKIHTRLGGWLKDGLVAEVKSLKEQGVGPARFKEFGLAYHFVYDYLEGKLTRDQMIAQSELSIRQYAKRQMTWFKQDKRIKWITRPEEAESLVKKFLG